MEHLSPNQAIWLARGAALGIFLRRRLERCAQCWASSASSGSAAEGCTRGSRAFMFAVAWGCSGRLWRTEAALTLWLGSALVLR
jgi:hypothetical protein